MVREAAILREELAEERGGRAGRGLRYRFELRQRATSHARNRSAEGESLGRVAMELGVPLITLQRWLKSDASGFRPVRVGAEVSPRAGVVVVVTPGGLRIEGLSAIEAAAIVRSLR